MPQRPRLTPAIADVRSAVRAGLEAAGVVAGDLVLVACSGGADSLALAAAAAFEGQRAGVRVGAAIVEHGLQPETAQVAKQTQSLLQQLGLDPVLVLPVTVATGTDNGGTEAAARTARYQALETAAHQTGADHVLLGHTLDDQAETVLLGLTRGSGPKSLAGMTAANGVWLRPLLQIRRQQTEAFCIDLGLAYWQDPHNIDEKYTRVRIRNNVLPLLEDELGPGVAQALARTAAIFQEDTAFLDALAAQTYAGLAQQNATQISFQVPQLEAIAAPVRKRVYAKAMQVFGSAFTQVHLVSIDELVANWHGQKELTLPGVRVVRTGDQIVFKTTKTLKPGVC